MRVRLLLVPAVVLAIVYSCGGTDHFNGKGTITGGGTNPGDAATTPDAGNPDAGDAGSTDAGCLLQNLPSGQVSAFDSCSSGGANLTASIIPASCLDVTITVSDGETCQGKLTGPTNAFSGTCTNALGTCTSNNLPGIINCVLANTNACAVQICSNLSATPNCPQ
jgi:hypothetical protein